jgi:hypothetical protein
LGRLAVVAPLNGEVDLSPLPATLHPQAAGRRALIVDAAEPWNRAVGRVVTLQAPSCPPGHDLAPPAAPHTVCHIQLCRHASPFAQRRAMSHFKPLYVAVSWLERLFRTWEVPGSDKALRLAILTGVIIVFLSLSRQVLG